MGVNKNNKIVFLDIDGVLCLYPEWQIDWCGNQNDFLDEQCCRNLKSIVDKTGAKIVITSSWRLEEADMESLYSQLEKYGIDQQHIVGATPDFRGYSSVVSHNDMRWQEIKDYISKNGIKKYVIIDDFNLEKFDKAHLVRTKKHEGLTSRLKDVCIAKLG